MVTYGQLLKDELRKINLKQKEADPKKLLIIINSQAKILDQNRKMIHDPFGLKRMDRDEALRMQIKFLNKEKLEKAREKIKLELDYVNEVLADLKREDIGDVKYNPNEPTYSTGHDHQNALGNIMLAVTIILFLLFVYFKFMA